MQFVATAAEVQLGRSVFILRRTTNAYQSWLPIEPPNMYREQVFADCRLGIPALAN